jgi:hypothetical protein
MKVQAEISKTTYDRLGAHARPFESLDQVITRMIDAYEKSQREEPASDLERQKQISHPDEDRELEIKFFPEDEAEFKRLLLANRQAWIVLHKLDGSKQLKHWNIYKFTKDSHLRGNLSSGYLRDWKKKGICKAEVAINKEDIGQ